MSKVIEENGVKVKFPDENYFEFDKCKAQITISGKDVKEMDAGWFDIQNNTLWLVELKAYYNPLNSKHISTDLRDSNFTNKILNGLTTKSIHSVSMSVQNRSNTQSCLPKVPDNRTVIKIVHLLRVLPGQDSFLNPMQDKLREALKPYTAIFKIDGIVILSYDYAVKEKLFNWIV